MKSRFCIIFLITLLCCGCSDSGATTQVIEVPTYQGTALTPTNTAGKIGEVLGEDVKEKVVTKFNTIFGIDIAIPANYTSHVVSVNGIPAIEYSSEKDNEVITLCPSEFSSSVSSPQLANSLVDYFNNKYGEEREIESQSTAVLDSGYYKNSITYTDGLMLTYLIRNKRAFVILGNKDNTSTQTLVNNILNPQPIQKNLETLPTTYKTLEGKNYYPVDNIDGPGTYIIFPLSKSKMTLQIFDADSQLKYDTYIKNNSTKLANHITLKLKKGDIIYTSGNIGISKKLQTEQ